MTRREAAWTVARAALVAGGAEFFQSWLRAAQPHDHSAAPPEPDRWTNYKPQFFSADEFRDLGTFTEILIPTDDTPGAREAHVAPFIDFVVNAAAEYEPDMQQHWRDAMAWLASQRFGSLSPSEQFALIEAMSSPERDKTAKHEGFSHYRLLKDMTVHAFYTSRVGLIDVLEYKGNAYLVEFPGCNHPEHQHT